jgi:type IV pilus assembly protein PilW
MRVSLKNTQKGMTLIELMIALLLSMFLLGGLYSLFDSNEIAYQDNQKLTELVDSERFSLAVISEVTELSGYFPNPLTQDAASVFQPDALFPYQAVSVAGTSGGTNGDTLAVRFMTAQNDGLLNCNGLGDTTATTELYENVFSVDDNHDLVCSLNGGAPEVLVNNVQSMMVEYGVQTSPDSTTTNFDTYKTAAEMSQQDWANIACVKVTLNFLNPMAGEPGQPTTIPVTRVIDIMSYSPFTTAVSVPSTTNTSANSGSSAQGNGSNGDNGDGGDGEAGGQNWGNGNR